jgi:hypothetical protein
VVAALAIGGRPDQGRHAAASAVARGVQLLAFTLARAAAAGVPRERLAEVIGAHAALVDQMLDRGPEPSVVAQLAPDGIEPQAVARAVASFEASVRVGAVVEAIMADVEDRSWSPASPELDDLAERLNDVWRRWRQDLGRRDGVGA